MSKLKEFFLRNRQYFIIGISTILIAAAVVNVYFTLEIRVTSNDECLWVPKDVGKDSTAIYFDLVKKGGVTWNAGIRDGDQLIAINGVHLNNVMQAQTVLNKVNEGEYANYTVKKNGKLFNTKVYVKKLVSLFNFSIALLGFFWMVIAFIVLLAKPEGFTQKLFYGLGVTTVLFMIRIWLPDSITGEMIRGNPVGYGIFSYFFFMGSIFLPFLLMYFFWSFPKPFNFLEKKWIKTLIFVFPAVIFIAYFVAFNLISFRIDLSPVLKSINYWIIWIGISNVIAWVSLLINYFRLKSKEERKKVFVILLAYTIGIVSFIYTATVAPAISDIVFNSPEYYTPIILIVLLPLAFAYSIFKYQLMDVSVVVKNTIVYGTATVALAAIYFFIIYIIGQSISGVIGTQYREFIAGIFFVFFALIFQSTKNRFQDFITQKFYPEQFAYQKVLLKFSNDIPTIVGKENILDSMNETFINSLQINTFGILLKNGEEGTFNLVRSEGIKNKAFAVTKSHLDNFVKEKLVISSTAVIEREDFVNIFPEQAVSLIDEKVFTIIPMIISNKPIGMLLFGLKHSGSQFAGKDIELLSAAANQSAVAIENARLYNSEVEKLKLEQDLTLARKIQEGLLPKEIPQFNKLDISGKMIPAMQVGGDYFDIIKLSENKLFVVAADVSGKGLSASLYMTKVQTIVQYLCSSEKSPKDILIEINKRLYTSFDKNSFVTMAVALFDLGKMTVKFSRAGHMPVVEAKGNEVCLHKSRGLGIGLEKGELFQKTLVEEELPLSPKQIFLFYSDGVTEAMNFSNDMFGEENLIAFLKNQKLNSASQIETELLNSINQFKGKAKQNDDITLVVVKVKPGTA